MCISVGCPCVFLLVGRVYCCWFAVRIFFLLFVLLLFGWCNLCWLCVFFSVALCIFICWICVILLVSRVYCRRLEVCTVVGWLCVLL